MTVGELIRRLRYLDWGTKVYLETPKFMGEVQSVFESCGEIVVSTYSESYENLNAKLKDALLEQGVKSN